MASPLLIGAHTSTVGGLHHALYEGKAIGATTVQIFTTNQKQWRGRILLPENLTQWEEARAETGLSHLMSHASYLINLGGPREEVLAKSRSAFREEVERCIALGISYLNFHPGAALDSDVQECLDRIVDGVLTVAPIMEGSSLRLLFEVTAGQGSSVGHSFEQLGYMIDRLKGTVPVGVCIDTCHLFVAGYDNRTTEGWNAILSDFDNLIGLPFLHAFHLNDSLKGLGSHVDRHQPLGEGEIGWECFRFLMTDPRTCLLPKYLETPGGPPLWKEEIRHLKALGRDHHAHKN